MNSILMLLDQATSGSGETTATTSGTGSIWTLLISFGLIALVFYFFMLRPQKKQEKEAAQMRDSLQVGDEVTTIGGIIGRVVSIKDETFTLETSRDRTKMRFLRSAIKSVDVKAADLRAATKTPAETAPSEAASTETASTKTVPAEETKNSKKSKKENKVKNTEADTKKSSDTETK